MGCRIPDYLEVAIDEGHIARYIQGLVFCNAGTNCLMDRTFDKMTKWMAWLQGYVNKEIFNRSILTCYIWWVNILFRPNCSGISDRRTWSKLDVGFRQHLEECLPHQKSDWSNISDALKWHFWTWRYVVDKIVAYLFCSWGQWNVEYGVELSSVMPMRWNWNTPVNLMIRYVT